MLRGVVLACVLGVFAPISALAEDIATTVTGGKRTLVGGFSVYSGFECTASGSPEPRIARQPANGRLDIVIERKTIRTDRCGPITFTSPSVYYTPRKGFRGADEAAVDFVYFLFNEGHETTNQRQTYIITVK